MKRVISLMCAMFGLLAAPLPSAASPWRAYNFVLRDTSGIERTLFSYKGKVVVLEFFASWCPTCAASVPSLNYLVKRYPEQVAVLAVATGEDDPHGLPGFIDELKPQYTILVDDTDAVGRKYRVLAFPTYLIIDAKGMVRATREGPIEWEDPRNQKTLEQLFDGPPADPGEAPMPVTTVSAGPWLR